MLRIVAALCSCLLVTQSAFAQGGPELNSLPQKAYYSIGYNIGKTLKAQPIRVDDKSLMLGLKDALADDRQPALTPEDMEAAVAAFESELEKRQMAKSKEIAAANKTTGDAFLAKNKQRNGINTLPSGLQIEVIKQGSGPTPTKESKVTVHYEGKLIDGTVFDSSIKRGKPMTFGVTQVIAGWTEALQKMKVGDRWRLYIPPDLAYGEKGSPTIQPNSVLIFDVELLGVE